MKSYEERVTKIFCPFKKNCCHFFHKWEGVNLHTKHFIRIKRIALFFSSMLFLELFLLLSLTHFCAITHIYVHTRKKNKRERVWKCVCACACKRKNRCVRVLRVRERQRKTRCQFHQHFTYAFLYKSFGQNFFVFTF